MAFLYLDFSFVLTKPVTRNDTRNNNGAITNPEQTKDNLKQQLDQEKNVYDNLNQEHANAQDHELTSEDSILENLLDSNKRVDALQALVDVIEKWI